MSDLLERIEDLPPKKRELLLQRLKDKRKGVAPLQITRQPRDTNQFPLSFAQQRLWFLDQFEPNSAHYNLSPVFRLHGRLDVDALEQSFQTILSRHETLRTTFAAVDGQPVQVIGGVSKFELPLVDLQNIPEAEREPHALQLVQDEGRRTFDLAVGPLLRMKLLRLAPEKHFLLLTMHHIITDGWSTGILLRELSALYSAAIKQQECRLPDLPIQYLDFAAWQQQWLQGDVLEKQLSYWREQLDSIPTALALPTDHARPPIQTFCGDHQAFSLSLPLSAALKKLSQQEGATLFMTLLAAFQVLLYRYSQQDDIVVGTPIANRNRAEIEGLIGFFVNTLVMRSNLAGEPSFLELLAQVRDTALSAYAHQDLPFEKLVQELEPERDLSRTPLFQVMFVLQNMPGKPPEFSGLKVNCLPAGLQTSMFDLTMYLTEYNDQITGSIEYNTDLFEATTIERLVQHFQILLQGIVADPTTSISALPILSPTEYHQVTEQWNDTRADFPDRAPIHQLFELQVERSPEAVALIDDGQQLTYRELNIRANQLAHFLQTKGLAATDLVGVCLERSAEMVVALLAVLKTGAAYVPLDPAYPRERLAFMLGDAQVSLLLTSEALSEVLPEHTAQTVHMDAQWQTIAQADQSNLAVTTTPESPAYVLYTSGSTGTPKGVVGRHRSAVNRFAWMWDRHPFAPHEVCCQKTSLNFVDSVWEIFGPLLQGVPTVIIPNQLLTDPPLLVQFLAQHQVTRMVLVPSLLRVLLETYDDLQDRLPLLTHWICSGEALSLELCKRFQAVMPQSTLLNLYGSSEVAADVTCFDTRLLQPEASSVPIGRPIANTQVHILDRHLRPVPIGVPAELYVGGGGLAQGYLNRPDLTEERFIPNPFNRESGARLYKTGDIVRYRQDGNLEFLGRVDDQVKVRGFRIELGEIEAVLTQHPKVKESAAVVREHEPGERRLVAYIIPNEPSTCSPKELKEFLQEKLPSYMIPSAFGFLDALPRTPNSKVDRQALPPPEGLAVEAEAEYVAPSTPYEKVLADTWAEVLGLERVGIRDNFFDLGGHSLLALRLRALMEKRLEKDVPLAILFQAPTIEQLAEMFDEGFRPAAWTSLIPMQKEGSNPPFFCVPEAGSTVYSLSNLARHLGAKQPFYGLQPVGMDGDRSPHTRIEDMAAHYIQEIKSAQPEGPYFLGGQCFGSEVAFEIAQQLCAQREEVALLALFGDNFIAAWARKGVGTSDSAYSLAHSFQRALYYLMHSSLGDVIRTALKEVNIRFNPRLRYTRRVFKAQLLARANYVRKPYPGRVTAFAARSSSPRTFSDSTLAGLAEGGVDLQRVPPVNDRLLDEPHVQVVAANLIACIKKVVDERSGTKSHTNQTQIAHAKKKDRGSSPPISIVDKSPRSTSADAPPADPRKCLDLSLVLPCYNEASHFSDSIGEIVRVLDAAELEYEIILIDDRSTDETAQQIRSYLSGQDTGNIRAYFHDAHLGRGATVAEGIRTARAPYVGFIDSNLETPPQFIPAALDPLMSDSADMVVADRKMVRPLEAPLRLVMSKVYRWLASQLLKTDSLDTAAGFKFFRRDLILPVLDGLQHSHWFWDTEITVVAQAEGLRICSLPVTYCRDLTKQSTDRVFHDSWRSFATLLAFAKRHRFA